MLDFSQFSGLVLFMFIFTAGFWLLIFLLTFVVPYWIGGTVWENFKLKQEAKKAAQGKQSSLNIDNKKTRSLNGTSFFMDFSERVTE